MAKIEIDKSEAVEGETVEKVWDIKKIAAGVVLLALLFIAGAYILLPSSESGKGGITQETLGISSSTNEEKISPPPLPNKEDIDNIILDAQDTLSQLTSENVTSSQAAIQKIISDLELLQGRKDAVDIMCSLVCKDK